MTLTGSITNDRSPLTYFHEIGGKSHTTTRSILHSRLALLTSFFQRVYLDRGRLWYREKKTYLMLPERQLYNGRLAINQVIVYRGVIPR